MVESFARHRLLDRLHVLRRLLALARRGARYPEVFHQLRVAVRRFRVAEAIVASRAPSPPLPRLGKELRRVARRAGRIRDDDVMAMALRDRAKARRTVAPVALALVRRLALRRVRRLARLDRALMDWSPQGHSGRAMAALNQALRRERAMPPMTLRAAEIGPLVAPVARTFLARAGAPLAGPVRLPSLHALRIAGKHLRYALEFLEPGLPPRLLRTARRVLKRLVRLQRALGDIQDRRVRMDWIACRAAKAAGRGALEAIALQRLEEVERRDLRTAIVRCGASWRQNLPVVRRHLAEMRRARIG
ncbi:MAG: CHAD domain-containing protein [Planctomycetes bacterium]|nr:CHAD domain-containing protein [Planctomycetota bacterium]